MNNNVFKRIITILDYIGRLDTIIASICMFAIVAVSIWGVFTRYIINSPSSWTEELSLGLFVWLTFFGISILARRGEIVSIEFLLHLLPKSIAFLFRKIIIPLITITALVILIYLGFKLAMFSYDRLTSILRIPFTYIYMGIPLGSLFTLYHVIRCTFSGPKFYEQTI